MLKILAKDLRYLIKLGGSPNLRVPEWHLIVDAAAASFQQDSYRS